MLRRLIWAGVLCAMGSAALFKWGDIPGGIRSLEAILKPVFHKEVINRFSGIYKEDPLFVTAIIKVESNFSKKAKSHRGAVGLMQIMPATAKEIATDLKIRSFAEGALEDPELNIRFGFHYLSKLKREFGDDAVAVLGAYNAGAKNVRTWIRQSGKGRLDLDDIEFPETRNFVQDVLATYQWLKRLQQWRNRILSRGT